MNDETAEERLRREMCEVSARWTPDDSIPLFERQQAVFTAHCERELANAK